jgi:hypothetical protein
MLTPAPNWHDLVPHIFDDPRFLKTGRRRFQLQLDARWAGIVVAWKPPGYENYGLNREDIERLIEKRDDGSLDAGFVVLATIENSQGGYVAHRDGEEVYESVKGIPPRSGQYGEYWLLRADFSPFDDLAIARERF